MRRYARRLQKLGYPVRLTNVRILTISARYTLSGQLDIQRLAASRKVEYEPELFPSATFKLNGITFGCFHSGKDVITGVKKNADFKNSVFPALIELELYAIKT